MKWLRNFTKSKFAFVLTKELKSEGLDLAHLIKFIYTIVVILLVFPISLIYIIYVSNWRKENAPSSKACEVALSDSFGSVMCCHHKDNLEVSEVLVILKYIPEHSWLKQPISQGRRLLGSHLSSGNEQKV